MNKIELHNDIVLDKSQLSKLNVTDYNNILAASFQSGKQVKIVDSIPTFFNEANMLQLLEETNSIKDLELIAEYQNIHISDHDKFIMNEFNNLKTRIRETYKAKKPLYVFATVPEKWSVVSHLVIGSKTVYRKNEGYTIGHKTLLKLWEKASKYWANSNSPRPGAMSISASGYSKRAIINKENIEIGCQNIKRFELEQLAIHLGWEFPI